MYKTIDKNDIDFLLSVCEKDDVIVGEEISEDFSHDELGGVEKYPEVLITERSMLMKIIYL